MTSEKLKPTPGPWLLDSNYAEDWETPNHELNTSTSSQAILSPDDEIVAFAVVSYDEWNDPVKEAQLTANALLIAEVGTVHHECGLSPRELLEAVREKDARINELVDALRGITEMCEFHGDFSNGVTDPTGTIDEGNVRACEFIHAARAALAKHKEV